MGKLEVTLPYEELELLRHYVDDSTEIFSEVVKAGGQAAYENVKANAPASFKKSPIMKKLKMTKVYRTPSDGAINVKVGFYGYFINQNKKVTPAPLVANVFEYGSSKFPKQPFFRRSVDSGKVIRTMGQKFRSFVREGKVSGKYE